MHEAYAATGDSYVIVFGINVHYIFVFYSTNALQLLLELLGTYTRETASKARADAFKYNSKI